MTETIETLLTDEKVQASIPIEHLKPSPLNTFMMMDVDDLAASIRRLGLLDPLIVAGPDEKGDYEILSGERRYRAILQLNKEAEEGGAEAGESEETGETGEDIPAPVPITEVSCEIIGKADLDSTVKQIIIEESNTETRHDVKWESHRFRLVSLYETLVEEKVIPESQLTHYIQKSLGISERYARMYRTIHRQATPELMNAVTSTKKKADSEEEGPVHIPVKDASVFSTLPEEEQKKIVNRVNQGEKPDDIQSEIIAQRRKEKEQQRRLDRLFSIPGGNSGENAGENRSSSYGFESQDAEDRSFRGPGRVQKESYEEGEENFGFMDDEEDGGDYGESPEDYEDDYEDDSYSSDSTIPFRPGKKYEDVDIGEELDGMEERLTGSGIMMPRENLHRDTTGMIGTLMQDDKVPEGTKIRYFNEVAEKILKTADRSALPEKYFNCVKTCMDISGDEFLRARKDAGKACLSWSDPSFRHALQNASDYLKAAEIPDDFDI